MIKFLLVFVAVLSLTACKPNKFKNSRICENGDCYNGRGTRAWKDGGYEKGQWINGELNGYGIEFFGSTSPFAGDTYEGYWINGKKEGFGIYYDKSSRSVYSGYWKNGKPDGIGKIIFNSISEFPDQWYIGEWKDGKKEGDGTMFYGTGGKYKNDIYTGQWKNNLMDGVGEYIHGVSGVSYAGEWKSNLRHGNGIHTDKNGKATFVHCVLDDCEPVR